MAQTALATLGLAAATAQDRDGYFLRSRCDLVPEAGSSQAFEIIDANGGVETVDLDIGQAGRLAGEAVRDAKAAGLDWNEEDLVLKPQAKLVQLVSASRRLAMQGEGEAETEADRESTKG